MIIDWQHHVSPEEVMRRRGGKTGRPFIKDGKVGMHLFSEVYEIDKQLAFMDAAGIDVAVASATLESVENCRLTADFYEEILKKHSDRFVCLAPCIPTRGKEALEELDRAMGMGMKGVVISPQNDGEHLDSKTLWPFYEKVSGYNVPIFVHITNIPQNYTAYDAPYNTNVLITREADVAHNTFRLIFGGVLSEFPDLTFVIAHMGGGIAAIMERWERYVGAWGEKLWVEQGGTPPFGEPYLENYKALFGKLYFDMAGFEGGMNAVKCALTTISPDRQVFGTDYPYNFTTDPEGVKRYMDNIRALGLPEDKVDGMLGGTAARLLGL